MCALRKTSPPVTPRQAALKSSGPVACSPNIATGNMVMEKLNSTSDDGDRVQPDSAGSSPTRSRATYGIILFMMLCSA